MQNNYLEKIAAERSNPCVTVSLSTHRTHPENAQDIVVLKNLLSEARKRVVNEFGKRDVSNLLDNIDNVENDIDVNYNLDSLHLFLSNDTKEIIKSPWPIQQNTVHISDSFSIKPLIKALNRTENYMILLLSQSGVNLFHAVNDTIVDEIKNDDFPFTKNLNYLTNHDKLSDGKQVDNMVREFLNKVDKAIVRVHNINEMNCVVVCTEDNYSRLIQVADKPSVYYGYIHINYNDIAHHTLAANAWEMVKTLQKQNRTNALQEMQMAVSKGNVITDLSAIFRAAKEGRGDLLITQNDFHQAVKMTGESSFELTDDVTQPDIIDDITSEIAWQVISKKGRVIFTSQDELKPFGNIALKVRY